MTSPVDTHASANERLREFVETLSSRCPGCHTQLTRVPEGRCPQCHIRLELGLGAPAGAMGAWLALVISVALAAGFCALVSLLALTGGAGPDAIWLYGMGLVSVVVLVVSLFQRKAFMRQSHRAQLSIVIVVSLLLYGGGFYSLWIAA